MPSWKKVIVSGSDAALNSLIVSNGVTGSLFGTASYSTSASQAITASYANYAVTASSALNSEDILIYVKNTTGAQIDKGKVVLISGATGDNPLISTASYEVDGLSANTLGITNQNIPNDSFGYVMTEGRLLGINTDNFTAGQLLYLGPTGSIIGTAPVAPLHSVRLGQVLRAQLNNGSMYVRIDNGYEIGELHDVVDTTTTSSFGDLLVKSGSVWTNSRQLTGSYGLTGSLQATSFTGSLFGTSSYATSASQAISSSRAINAGNASTIDISLFGNPVDSYLLMSNVAGTTGVAVGADADLRYNANTNVLTLTGTINASSFTGSLLGTSSYATSASQAISSSFAVNASSSLFAVSSSRSISSSFATIASSSLFATSASQAISASFAINASSSLFAVSSSRTISSSFATIASSSLFATSASQAASASFVNTLNQNVIITGSAAIGATSGASENTLTLGARDTVGEGGQLGFNAPGGTYTSASMIDNYQNRLRILRGTNAGSDAEFFSLNLHSGQAVLNRYTGSGAFPGTTTGILGVDSSGNIITTTAGGTGTVTQVNTSGTVNGLTLTGGPITTTGTITLGGTLSNILTSSLAQSGSTIGSTFVGLGSTVTTLAGLTSVTSTNFTGTASYATSASQAISSSFAVNASSSLRAVTATQANQSSTVSVSGVSTNAEFTFPFIATGSSGASIGLNTDTATGVFYNPSTNLLRVTNLTATGSLLGTASFSDNSTSASFAINASSSLQATNALSSSKVRVSDLNTTSTPQYVTFVSSQTDYPTIWTDIDLTYVPNTNTLSVTSSYATSASQAISSSFATVAQSVLGTITNASTASNITPAITNALNNRVLTANGGGTINGESNLTFNGTTLGVTGSLEQGFSNITQGNYSHAEGSSNIAAGNYSHAEGAGTYTIGFGSHAEGDHAHAKGQGSHAEGYYTSASGNYSHAEGETTLAGGVSSHAEGLGTFALGDYSHAEGTTTIAFGEASHAEGDGTYAGGFGSHAAGYATSASGNFQSVIGATNLPSTNPYAFIIGNGKADLSLRSNLLYASGSNVQITGSLYVSRSDNPNKSAVYTTPGTKTEPAYTFIGDDDTGMFNLTTNTVALTGGGNIRLQASDSELRLSPGTTSAQANILMANNDTIPLVSLTAASSVTVGNATNASTATIALSTDQSVTFNNGGSGAASGTTFNGSTARTISYNTIGAPSTSGTNATGTWGISITGNAATATSASFATNASSSLFAVSSSFAANASSSLRAVSSSFATLAASATTAGTATTATSASFATNAQNVLGTVTNATSASRAISASHADLLDGLHATSFVLNSQTSSMSVNYANSTDVASKTIQESTGGTGTYYMMMTPTAVSGNGRSYNTSNQTDPISYNAATATLTSKYFVGALTGNASTATTASFATNAQNVLGTVTNATSASRAISSSFATLAASATSATSATSAGSVTNAVTFNNGGSGDASGTTFNGSAARTISYNTVGALPSGLAQQGGKTYVTHDFNSYPNIYDTTFINPIGSSNLPTNMSSVMSYRFIMGGGDTAARGVDLVVAAESSGNMYMRERSIGTWSRMLHSNNYNSYSPTLTGTGASGTWGIGISGNAATATSASMASTVSITNQDTTPVTYYLTFVGGTSGNNSLAVDSTTLTYYPSDGTFTAPIVNSATGVRGGNGSASTPAFSFSGDTNTGMYNITADTLGFSTAGSERLRITAGGAMGLGVTPTNTAGRFEASNDVVAYSTSDKRWKNNIVKIDSPLEKLSQISGVEFDWIEDEPLHGNKGHDVGVIAQEIELVIPEAVQTRESGMKAVQYDKIIPLLIESIKEQQKQIDELKELVNKLTK